MRKILIAAAVVGLLLCLGLLSCKVRGNDPEGQELAWERVISPDLPTPSDLYGGEGWELNGVCFVSATEGWAVGGKETVYGEVPLVYHYQNGTWTEVSPPLGGDYYFSGVLYAVAVDGNGNVWCVGEVTYAGYAVAMVRSGTWADVDLTAVEVTQLHDVAINTNDHAVAVGDDAVLEMGLVPPNYVYAVISDAYPDTGLGEVYAVDWGDQGYVGGNYVAMATYDNFACIWESHDTYQTNTSPSIDGGCVFGLDLRSNGTGWGVGYASGPMLLQHGAGGWTQYDASALPAGMRVRRVSLSSATEGWAVGYIGAEDGVGAVLRYQAGTWTDGTSGVSDLVEGFWWLEGVAAPSSNEAWAVGSTSNEGILLHYHQVN